MPVTLSQVVHPQTNRVCIYARIPTIPQQIQSAYVDIGNPSAICNIVDCSCTHIRQPSASIRSPAVRALWKLYYSFVHQRTISILVSRSTTGFSTVPTIGQVWDVTYIDVRADSQVPLPQNTNVRVTLASTTLIGKLQHVL